MRPEKAAGAYRLPAEWHDHEATWLAWPHNEDDFPGKLQAVEWVFARVVAQLVVREQVRILVHPKGGKRRAKKVLMDEGVPLANVEFFEVATDRSWVRDSLPLFVLPVKAGRRSAPPLPTKFRFNGWARYPDHKLDEKAGQYVANWVNKSAVLPSLDARDGGKRKRIVLEGGAIDVDGEGTALVTEQCLLGTRYCRNRGVTKVGVERFLAKYLGVQKTIWLGEGICGDDTSGHVDDFARFVGPGTVVVSAERTASDENHAPLVAARERLEHARDVAGRKLEVVTLPMPKPVFYRGERLPASYANFYIANGCVLVPTFDDPADRIALGILSELFPNRDVCGIHARELVVGLGTFHCSTMQQPSP